MFTWDQHVDRKLQELREQGTRGLSTRFLSFTDIAHIMNDWWGEDVFTSDMLQKRYQKLVPPPSLRDHPPANPTPYFSKYFDRDGQLIHAAPAKMDLDKYVADLERAGRAYKTLVLSDTQGIFCDEALLEEALDANPYADIIVLPGDVCDWEGASKYTHERDYPLIHESDWYVRLLETLTRRYPGVPVVITNSNHRRRIEKSVRQLPQGLLFLVEHNPERYLAQPFSNVFAIEPWFWQCGDVIYAHAEGRTTNPGDNAKSAIDAFLLRERTAREGIRPFRAVLTGHSHKIWEGVYKSIKGIEPGCLAELPMIYTKAASSLRTVQENGYAYAVQRGGKVDFNQFRHVYLRRDG